MFRDMDLRCSDLFLFVLPPALPVLSPALSGPALPWPDFSLCLQSHHLEINTQLAPQLIDRDTGPPVRHQILWPACI